MIHRRLRIALRILLGAALSVMGYVAIVVFVNSRTMPDKIQVQESPVRSDPAAREELEILTWNLGYGGLGASANFFADGGTDWLPESRSLVESNLAGVRKTLADMDPDIFLFQEMARPSLLSRRVDLVEGVSTDLAGFDRFFFPDFRTRFIPPPFNLHMGLAMFSRSGFTTKAESALLPLEPPRFGFRKFYQIVTTRIPTDVPGVDWVISNVHLAAFDEGGDVRRQQLTMVREMAMAEYEKGHLVVIGGDWNMRLVDTDFPHQTDEKYLFWIHDLPDGAFPEDWKIVTDSETPSVRTLHQAYEPGDNYTCVIDGFIASPNVSVLSVKTKDLGFANSDHQPVIAKFSRSER